MTKMTKDDFGIPYQTSKTYRGGVAGESKCFCFTQSLHPFSVVPKHPLTIKPPLPSLLLPSSSHFRPLTSLPSSSISSKVSNSISYQVFVHLPAVPSSP